MEIPREIRGLLDALMKLPGIGEKTAEEIVHALLAYPAFLSELREALEGIQGLRVCEVCGSWTRESPCFFCTDPTREPRLLVVPFPKDVWLFERTGFRGRYHVLGGLLSPLEGVHAEDLRLDPLRIRLEGMAWEEMILALGATFEAETTASFLVSWLREQGLVIPVTRLGVGLPVGKSLDRMDLDTLREALFNRKPVDEPSS